MSDTDSEQGFKKILDMTRMMAIALLLIHFYYSCYQAFLTWGWTTQVTNRLLLNLARTGLFYPFSRPKLISLGLLLISLLGTRGRKEITIGHKTVLIYFVPGLGLYFLSYLTFYMPLEQLAKAVLYMGSTTLGFILMLTGGTLFSRIIQRHLGAGAFNRENETFPQEERLLQNEYSINLPARYKLKGTVRSSWINIINPFRGLLVMGTPGSGKSYFIIEKVIRQHLEKGFAMFVYDFKFPDLTQVTYHHFLKNLQAFPNAASFHVINFDDLSHSHRANPLDPSTLHDITDAAECSRTLMLGLNREWIDKQGDFFVESSINFITALIWYLRLYHDGRYCTLPHVIELAQTDYAKLFSVLRAEPEIEVLVNPFVSAYLNEANEQLEGQIASAKISLARLVSPSLYYVLSGDDFSLDINNPRTPKIVCMGNNPQKAATYGAVLSLYLITLTRLVNKKGGHKCSLVLDEFPTIYFGGIDHLMATARSNRVTTTIAVQDSSQLTLHYGNKQASVILNIVGNIISGQVSGESAKWLAERFSKVVQPKVSISTDSKDTSVSHSTQLEVAVPPSTISSLSSGEFVGIVADNPDTTIQHKAFHCRINTPNQFNAVKEDHRAVPFVRQATNSIVLKNYVAIKKDIRLLIEEEINRLMNTPELETLIIRK